MDLSRLEVESATAFYSIVGFLLYDRLMLLLPSLKGSLGTEDDLGWLSPTGRGRIECDSLKTDFFYLFYHTHVEPSVTCLLKVHVKKLNW